MDSVKQNPIKQRRVMWLYCERCGKRLLRRLPNGLFEFEYGRARNNPQALARVRIRIYGDIQMHCLNVNCNCVSEFNMLPVPPKNREALNQKEGGE